MEFQITGIAILLLFYGCYISKMIIQRKKGIKTDQIGKGKSGPAKAIELTMKAASYTVLIFEVISILLNASLLPLPVRAAGAVAGIAGAAVFITSVWTMRDSWRAGVSKAEKTSLVTDGIYRFSRNPAFLGFYLVYISIAVMFFNWVLLAASLFAIVMLHLQVVKVEEPFLIEVFGADYLEYAGTVRRYLGRK